MRLALILLFLDSSIALKFLAYAPLFGTSHVTFLSKLSEHLIEGGHEVVLLCPRLDTLIKAPSIRGARVIEVPQCREAEDFERVMRNIAERAWTATNLMELSEGGDVLMQGWYAQCNATLNHPGLIDTLRGEKFDAAFTESVDFCSLGIFNLAEITKFAVTESLAMVDGHFFYSQVPSNPAYVPSFSSGFGGDRMTFMERASNFLLSFMTGIAKVAFLAEYEKVFREYDPELPAMTELAMSNSLVFMNSDPLLDFPHPSAARIIDIGGVASEDYGASQGLNKTWSTILDLRPRTVLVSFGSFSQAHSMPDAYKKTLLETVTKLPDATFILKYEKPDHKISAGIDNLIETTWMPQSELLHDPRLSAFITHGGQASLTEAYYAGVPMIVIPLCFDQLRNAAQVLRNGVGLVVEKTELTSGNALEAVIREILSNESYREKSRSVQQLLRDRPFAMREVFVRNMEFLAGHGPLRQLDHYGRRLNFAQYYLVDVIAALIGVVLLLVMALLIIMRAIVRRVINCLAKKAKCD